MKTKSFIVILAACLALCCVGYCFGGHNKCTEAKIEESGLDLKPVIYLYPEEDGTEVEVSLNYDGNLNELIPEFSSENKWEVVADKDGTITYDGQTYDYLFWEGDPNYDYDFYSGFCVKGSDTESFLNAKLHEMGLNDSETAEFIEFWLPRMEGNEFNMISFQGDTYKKGAKLSVSPQPDNIIRVFMAWYPTDRYVKINPQSIPEGNRDGFTVVEWGGNQVK
ncbi:MAG: hypothetical protein IKO84_05580 [Butyrivibrio sp.]|nr:hypothetical protein [Butyrivibrio sp.]